MNEEQLFMEYMNQFFKERKQELEILVENVVNTAMDYLFELAVDMYDSFIQQYYRKPTKKYIRHYTGRSGVNYGYNLYEGKNIEFNSGVIDIEFSGKNMADYYIGKRFNCSADLVLEKVMAGWRGIPGKHGTRWTGSFDNYYFSQHNVTMDKAFSLFDNEFNNIAYEIAMDQVDAELSCGNYKRL